MQKNKNMQVPHPNTFDTMDATTQLEQTFPLNFILYPAFFSQACSEDLIGIISNHVVKKVKDERQKVDDYFYQSKLTYGKPEVDFERRSPPRVRRHSSLKKKHTKQGRSRSVKFAERVDMRGKFYGTFKKTTKFFKDDFDVESIITPHKEFEAFCARNVRKNTSTSLLVHNANKTKESEALNRAKKEFIRLQQIKRKRRIHQHHFDAVNNKTALLHHHNVRDSNGQHFLNQQNKKAHAFVDKIYSPVGQQQRDFVPSSSTSPVISESERRFLFESEQTGAIGRQELRHFMAAHGTEGGSFDLIAVVFTLLNYFKTSDRWVKKVNKRAYGFTIKINHENKEQALQFLEDLEKSPEEPIKSCSITRKKDYYNFHVSCGNMTQVENAIQILMHKHCKAKLSAKMFKK